MLETNRDGGSGERPDAPAALLDRARGNDVVRARGAAIDVLLRFRPVERGASRYGGVSGDDLGGGGGVEVGERMLVKDVKRGRMYDSVEGGGGGGGVGGRGGGNQVCRERRARSEVT